MSGMITTVDGLFMSLILLTLSGFFADAYGKWRYMGIVGKKKAVAARALILLRRKRKFNLGYQAAALSRPLRLPHGVWLPRSRCGGKSCAFKPGRRPRGRRARIPARVLGVIAPFGTSFRSGEPGPAALHGLFYPGR